MGDGRALVHGELGGERKLAAQRSDDQQAHGRGPSFFPRPAERGEGAERAKRSEAGEGRLISVQTSSPSPGSRRCRSPPSPRKRGEGKGGALGAERISFVPPCSFPSWSRPASPRPARLRRARP